MAQARQDKVLKECENEIFKLRLAKTRSIEKFEFFLSCFKTKQSPHLIDQMGMFHMEAKAMTPQLIALANSIVTTQSANLGRVTEKRRERFEKRLAEIDNIEVDLNTEDEGRADLLTMSRNSLEVMNGDIEQLRREENRINIETAVRENRDLARSGNSQSHRLKVEGSLKPTTLVQDLKAVACRKWLDKFKLYIKSGGVVEDEDGNQR